MPKLATACICFLNARHADARISAWKDHLDRGLPTSWRTDFLRYCSDFWGRHFPSNPSTDDVQHMLALETNTIICGLAARRLMLNALQNDKYLVKIYHPDPHTSMAYIAAILDINAYWQHRVHNIHEASFKGYTPLHLACIVGHKDGVERLLSLGANVECKTFLNEERPLHFAAKNGHLEILQLLLIQGAADVRSRNRFGNTPLCYACKHGHSKIVQLLLARDDVWLYDAYWFDHPLSVASYNRHLQIVEMLLDRIVVHPELVDNILEACYRGSPQIVKLLLARENVQVDSRSAIRWGPSPLFTAAAYGYAKIVRMLLERKDVEVNSQDDDGSSPLLKACRCGNMETVRHLLGRHDIDVNLTDHRGHSPLWAACARGHMEVVELLLDRHDINLRDQNPLWGAAQYGQVDVVQRLLAWLDKLGIEVESPENEFKGQSPLEVAEKFSRAQRYR
jgi:ankyrin repeat protein